MLPLCSARSACSRKFAPRATSARKDAVRSRTAGKVVLNQPIRQQSRAQAVPCSLAQTERRGDGNVSGDIDADILARLQTENPTRA